MTAFKVVELLRSAKDAFLGVLAKLEGHIELGVKVLWDQDLIAREAAGHDAQALLEALRPLATAVREVRPIGERMIRNAAFLVAREHEAAFDAKLRSLAARFELLTLQYTGPWAHCSPVRSEPHLSLLTSEEWTPSLTAHEEGMGPKIGPIYPDLTS